LHSVQVTVPSVVVDPVPVFQDGSDGPDVPGVVHVYTWPLAVAGMTRALILYCFKLARLIISNIIMHLRYVELIELLEFIELPGS